MCLYNPKKVHLKEDRISYKIVKKDLYSLYKDFPYKMGQLYTLDKSLEVLKDVPIYPEFDKSAKYDIINVGFHSFREPKETKYCILVECTIPKDAEVYEGFDGFGRLCYVSNQIKINKIVLQIN